MNGTVLGERVPNQAPTKWHRGYGRTSVSQRRTSQAVESPLRCPFGSACYSVNLAPRTTFSAQAGDLKRVQSHPRSSERLAFCSRIPDAGADPLGNQAAFEFGHGTENRKDHLTCGRAGVHLLRKANEVNAEGLEGFEGTEPVRHRPGEAVELPNNDGGETLRFLRRAGGHF